MISRAEVEAIWREIDLVEGIVKRAKSNLRRLLGAINSLPKTKKEQFLRITDDTVVEVLYEDRLVDAVFVKKDDSITIAELKRDGTVGRELDIKKIDGFSALLLSRVIAEALLFRIL